MIYETDRKNLRTALQAGAIKRSERDRDISAQWFKLDEEAWKASVR